MQRAGEGRLKDNPTVDAPGKTVGIVSEGTERINLLLLLLLLGVGKVASSLLP